MAETPPALPWKTWLLLFAIDTIVNAARRRDGTLNRCLISLFHLTASPNPRPVSGVATSDHTVDPSRGLWVRLFTPQPPATAVASPPQLPVIVYFHGGGFALHSAATRPYDALCRRIAHAVPAVVVSVEYRLAPEHPYPAAYDDGCDALRWVDGAAALLPDVSAVFLAGDSAGGNIAHHVALRAAAAGSYERVVVAGAALLQPFFGGEGRTESEEMYGRGLPLTNELTDWFWRAFLPEGADRDHPAANVFGSGSGPELAGFPPTAVFVGGRDPLRDRQMGYVEGLRAAGVEVRLVDYPGAIHGFYAFPELPKATEVITEIRDFVWAQQGKRRSGLGPETTEDSLPGSII